MWLMFTYHSTNHDDIRSQDLADGEDVKHPYDPQHDIEAVDHVTDLECCWVQAHGDGEEEQQHRTTIAQIPIAGGPLLELL